jgi:soluble cytochrome b562
MAKRLSDEELKALTDAEMRQAVGFYGGKLAEQRRKAEQYFYGVAEGDLAPPEVVGRSSVVVPVVRNTIEAMLPQLMVKFTGGDTVVEFEPTLPDDEQKAKNCTDYLNYLFFKKNNGHSVTYSWFKDALKLKRGIVKVWWDTRDEETREEYRGLSQVELAQIMDDPEVEVIEQKSYPDEEDAKQRQQAMEQMQGQLDQAVAAAEAGDQQAAQAIPQIQAQMKQVMSTPAALLYDIACKRKKTGGKLCIENVPPEEFLISRKAKNIQESPFVGHRVRRTLSELRSQGYPEAKLQNLGADNNEWANAERAERMTFDDDYVDQEEDAADPSQRRVWLTECYMRIDYDGDGIAELRKICRAGGEILSNEIVDIIPFVSICPVPEPHKFFGLSVADLAMEGQKTETALLRATLDNLYLEVNGRYYAIENQVNLDDLLSSRPGGVVRIKSAGAVGRLDQGKGNIGESMGMLEYMKGYNEDSTGWSRMSQGNDPSSLNKPETATKANIVTNKADMRVDLIARNFAEGFVELFKMMLKLVGQYQRKAVQIKLSGRWVDMDPREWRNQFDVSINVGLGVGNKDQQVGHLMTLFQAQGQAGQLGIVKPTNVYALLGEMAKAMGFKSPDKFFSEPDPNQPPPDPSQGAAQIEQMKAQMQAQATVQAEQIKAQAQVTIERERASQQAQVDMARQEAEAQQQALKMQNEKELALFKEQLADARHQREVQAEMVKAVEVAKINAQGRLDAAQVSAQTTLSAEQEAASDAATND